MTAPSKYACRECCQVSTTDMARASTTPSVIGTSMLTLPARNARSALSKNGRPA